MNPRTDAPVRKINLTIPVEDYDWLKQHPEIKPSGLLQKCIREMRERIEK